MILMQNNTPYNNIKHCWVHEYCITFDTVFPKSNVTYTETKSLFIFELISRPPLTLLNHLSVPLLIIIARVFKIEEDET